MTYAQLQQKFKTQLPVLSAAVLSRFREHGLVDAGHGPEHPGSRRSPAGGALVSIIRRIWDYVIIACLMIVTMIDELRTPDSPDDK